MELRINKSLTCGVTKKAGKVLWGGLFVGSG